MSYDDCSEDISPDLSDELETLSELIEGGEIKTADRLEEKCLTLARRMVDTGRDREYIVSRLMDEITSEYTLEDD